MKIPKKEIISKVPSSDFTRAYDFNNLVPYKTFLVFEKR